MTCGCGREVPEIAIEHSVVTGRRLVCSDCGARSLPVMLGLSARYVAWLERLDADFVAEQAILDAERRASGIPVG